SQTATAKVLQGSTTTFDIKEQNDGTAIDSLTMKGPGSKTGFTVHYYPGLTSTTDITSQVVAGTYTFSNLASGSSKVLRIVIVADSAVPVGTIKSWVIVATSVNDSSKADAVRAKMNVNG